MKADVAQYPKKIARLSLETTRDYLSGKTVPQNVPVEVELINKEALGKRSSLK